jgi:hypothetical protein
MMTPPKVFGSIVVYGILKTLMDVSPIFGIQSPFLAEPPKQDCIPGSSQQNGACLEIGEYSNRDRPLGSVHAFRV